MPWEVKSAVNMYLCLALLDKVLPQEQSLNCTHGAADVLAILNPESCFDLLPSITVGGLVEDCKSKDEKNK